ncbi:hypothetical protein PP175_16280 [Aneurinibacillus sp. Ricciae_BoGa-3]|uniref:hypothetical protein n=1 Tax=Aneurinibacillus sp. Ricciae_BoGa-3 TaxID=3022697 RepID=UPI002341452D|nr:hypothetical protein [Aneurinibacillus sp. Ricciae_BoGa-3]WCK52971.1 hypothetical protein PP175_16280 [Aneurinibacillus sp. Ricciae_BoGa-3]
MYYSQPNPWYSPYQPGRQETMMPGDMQQMREMMKEHMRMTDEIRRVVHEINDRCRRMEERMDQMQGKTMM